MIPWGKSGLVITVQIAVGDRSVERAVARVRRLVQRVWIRGQQVIGVHDLRNGGSRYVPPDPPRGASAPSDLSDGSDLSEAPGSGSPALQVPLETGTLAPQGPAETTTLAPDDPTQEGATGGN